ncbi:5-oxoprolinase subunit C family protein [Streptomyces millisiae]|uniref:Biotin-dependent carboxyltransferase family protein n=1 Tax=Streptomyces millisiae TaxID=3075542 RepID=A0ABU2LI49_9ACTN|nr:biotin-dependent carboxyltransferase family protein [Streptomyces sp. DSM 44918]MDT0317264.1 biotin-dependent carboxyltransferase family protein [Streptomyces sp. DSM 44918]
MTPWRLEILATGPLATVQDRGRPGWAELGVPRSGAADGPALALANRLVGNAVDAAGVETTFGGLRVRARGPGARYVAVTGAPGAVTVDGVPAPFAAPLALGDGAVLELGPPASGLRSYLAVRGGLDVPPVLGSRATDLLSGLGPAPLRAGDTLPVGEPAAPFPGVDAAPCSAPPGEFALRVLPGPRDDWFPPAAVESLCAARWTATSDSNRVGIRLSGPELRRARDGELPAEGMVAGALQVPPNGQPVLFLADHPVTGGYPVIAVVLGADLPLAGQIPPGAAVRFRSARV